MPGAGRDEVGPVDRLGADEAPLEVGVDHAGGLRCGRSGPEGPGPGLLLPCRQIGAQSHQLVGGADEAGKGALSQSETFEHLGSFVEVELRRLGLELNARGDDLGAAESISHGSGDLIGFVELVFADVDDGEHRLVGQEEVGLELDPFVVGEITLVDRRALGEDGDHPFEERRVGRSALVGTSDTGHFVELLLGGLEIGERQLGLDDAEVFERIGGPGYVVVGKGPEHEDDRVDLTDARQELVAETLALAGPLDQPADVVELHAGVDDVP